MCRACLHARTIVVLALATLLSTPAPQSHADNVALTVREDGAGHLLCIGDEPPFHTTSDGVTRARLIEVPGTDILLAIWREHRPTGEIAPWYAVSLGRNRGTGQPRQPRDFERVIRTSYELKLRNGAPVPPSLAADPDARLFIVQYATQPLEAFTRAIEASGGTVRHTLAQHAHVVEMDPALRVRVESLPFVRWVGPFHPAYRLEPAILQHLAESGIELPPIPYNIQVFQRGLPQQQRVADRIAALGGTVHLTTPRGFRLVATLDGNQLRRVVQMDEIAFIDRWGPLEPDMDIVREVTGANYVEQVGGYTGLGVRGEVFDTGVFEDHCDLQSDPILFHTPNSTSSFIHGTAIMGIVFGDGTCNSAARGLLPDGSPIFAYYQAVPDAYAHTAELVSPFRPYQAVFQTRSVGSPRTTDYTTISAEIDDVLFLNDILVTQAQGNGSLQDSRPEAWAKNIVSVGGIVHNNNLSPMDDCWCSLASIGPASDGRIKPDLVHFYDNILTIGSGCYDCYGTFGGTSASTPIVAGCFGLFFQMWDDGLFINPVDPAGSVFDNRPHMTTAKAMLINTAGQYAFSGSAHDLTRTHQGWGLPDLRTLYDSRAAFYIIDESDVLEPLDVVQHATVVDPGEPAFKATLVYADPPGAPFSAQHRINDLTLRVVSPSAVVYWGNHGLLEGNWSTPGGGANTIDTVENVFVENPEPGTWIVEVRADEINQDAHLETPTMDADYALVVSGVHPGPIRPGVLNCDGAATRDDVAPFVLALIDPAGYSAAFPSCNLNHADTNADGLIDGGDIPSFADLLLP